MALDEQDHRLLVLWAADCAEHVLQYFEEELPSDDRPRKAVEAGRAWARGEIKMTEARTAAFAAHAAARDAPTDVARAAARAAGHAAATAHVPAHARHAATYAATSASRASTLGGATASAMDDAAAAAARERSWQYDLLSHHLRPLAFPSQV